MAVIPLRAVLPGTVDPALCKLHCAVWNGENHPIDVLARDWDEWTPHRSIASHEQDPATELRHAPLRHAVVRQ